MSRIQWSETMRRPNAKPSRKTRTGRWVAIWVLLVGAVVSGTGWYCAQAWASAAGLAMRAERWPAESRVPRRADVANVVGFVPADYQWLESDAAALESLVQDRLLSATIVIGAPMQKRKGMAMPAGSSTTAVRSTIKVFHDGDNLARRDFGVRHGVEYLVYDADGQLVDTCRSAAEIEGALMRLGISPRWSSRETLPSARGISFNEHYALPVVEQ